MLRAPRWTDEPARRLDAARARAAGYLPVANELRFVWMSDTARRARLPDGGGARSGATGRVAAALLSLRATPLLGLPRGAAPRRRSSSATRSVCGSRSHGDQVDPARPGGDGGGRAWPPLARDRAIDAEPLAPGGLPPDLARAGDAPAFGGRPRNHGQRPSRGARHRGATGHQRPHSSPRDRRDAGDRCGSGAGGDRDSHGRGRSRVRRLADLLAPRSDLRRAGTELGDVPLWLVVVGDGPDLHRYRELAFERGWLGTSVLFLGALPYGRDRRQPSAPATSPTASAGPRPAFRPSCSTTWHSACRSWSRASLSCAKS